MEVKVVEGLRPVQLWSHILPICSPFSLLSLEELVTRIMFAEDSELLASV